MTSVEQAVMFNTAQCGSPSFIMGLQPGDVCMFSRSGVFNTLISIKTWSRITHVEVVASKPLPGVAVMAASRNGQGVNLYPSNFDGCALVLRLNTLVPGVVWDADKALEWMRLVQGQKYDWIGLLNFTYARWASEQNQKMFCSEFAIRFLRRGGLVGPADILPEQDADTVAPSAFIATPGLRVIWRSPDEWKRWQTAQAEGRFT